MPKTRFFLPYFGMEPWADQEPGLSPYLGRVKYYVLIILNGTLILRYGQVPGPNN